MKINRFNDSLQYDEPSEDDYVLINANKMLSSLSDDVDKKFINFINNNVGQIYYIYRYSHDIKVKYDNIPDDILNRFHNDPDIEIKPIVNNLCLFGDSLILDYSKNKEELELNLITKKFNL